MRGLRLAVFGIGLSACCPLFGQSQNYVGTNVTGQLVLSRTVNVLQLTAAQRFQAFRFSAPIAETKPKVLPRYRPPVLPSTRRLFALAAGPSTQSLIVNPGSASFGFAGMTHAEQRLANNGNQFSVEPPSQSIAVANGFLLEGVNNAIRVYSVSGAPLLPKVLSTNELYGLPAAIDRSTGINGVFPTDMRVFFDQTISRWFVLQRAQDNALDGSPLNRSHLYLAVSQTADPTGTYNIYTMDTTDTQNPGCPCVADYPQIGADQFGFYISVNEYNTFTEGFVNASIFAISKASLATGAASPTTYRFLLPFASGYEFAIQPAATPPGASYFLGNGGLEYFISSSTSGGSSMAVWAMYNTGSLQTPNPNLLLTRINVPTLTYFSPDVANQRPGPLPLGSSLSPPGFLPFIDGGDTRIQSVMYAGGRLYVTLATQVTDETLRSVVGSAYIIFSPTFRAGVLAGPVLRQGYLVVRNNHLLRPAIAVNPQGRGAIALTLVGPDYYPSAAFVPIDTFSTGAAIQVAAAGALPEDGFTAYAQFGGSGLARWGDYSGAVATSDGAVWMATEYIPNAPRTELANWGTFLFQYMP